MKIITMNINGLKSAWDGGLKEYVMELNPDIFCMQEIRMSQNLIRYFVPGYEEYYVPSAQKGRAGVGILTKPKPLTVIKGLGIPGSGDQGRAVTIDMKKLYLVNVYAPASGQNLERLEEKTRWMEDLRRFVAYLEKDKPVIVCGDLNIAISPWDMPACVVGQRTAGNTEEERSAISRFLNDGYVDVWKMANRSRSGVTWTPYWIRRNKELYGWRLDYFLVSNKIIDQVKNCQILEHVNFSDHRAVLLEMK